MIYDNVEDFSLIKRYLPEDPNIWGHGKVLITTRNANIKKENYIQSENVISLDELKEGEMLTLLSKILYGCDPEKIPSSQKEEAIFF